MTSTENDGWLNSRHEAVFAHIQREIAAGRLTPGTKLLGERRFAEQLSVSRETVRLGLRMAEQAGLIVRVPTRGTFVAPPRVDQDLGRMDAFDSTVRHLHLSPAYQLVRTGSVAADSQQAERLGSVPGTELLSVEVLGVGSGLPLAYYQSFLPPHVVERLPGEPEWGAKSTYQIAGHALGANDLDVSQEFEAVPLPREIAQLLRVSAKSAGFRTVSLFTHGATPVELRIGWYPGSRYRFRITRQVRLTE
ncbi:GntR family transcriptional regulator [Jatrophihabitans cynanchi]|uniref:GntR family transcriptional regulator n=1 Tax=Jatrophihabitans cynanchi TaxID=2944128 RepID=A0ABY7JUY4_9ACTN|nr:GntR family transcriptional regulator [Jatrophihabitans sp. SB3-54]WAX55162.1 GntR family transcriptional regulator [Jatrophihabitans sp. SB3-54]